MDDNKEIVISSEEAYTGKMINLRVDTVELPDKKYSKREMVEHPGSVGIIATDENGQLILIEQYRNAAKDTILEIPAGKIDIGEGQKEAAIRELKEETGYTAEDLEFALEFYTSVGYSEETLRLYIGKNLVPGDQELDENEKIQVVKLDLEEAYKKIQKGQIIDSKTIIAILYLLKENNE